MNFIGIGAGKCGSTWVYENIVTHPKICNQNLKELNYFSDLYTEFDISWYESQFCNCDKGHLKGEFSVTYLAHPSAPERIKSHYPEAKLIAIFRDPTKRTFSNYLHSIRKGDISPKLPFCDYIKDTKKLETSCYIKHLENFYEHFHREQILVIVLEDFLVDTEAGMREVFQFLDVPHADFMPQNLEKSLNEAQRFRFLGIENLLVKTFRYLSRQGHTKLVRRILDTGIAQFVRRLNKADKPLPTIDAESKNALDHFFAPYNQALRESTGKTLDAWSS